MLCVCEAFALVMSLTHFVTSKLWQKLSFISHQDGMHHDINNALLNDCIAGV